MDTYSTGLIKDFYQDENDPQNTGVFDMKITVSGVISDITMLDAIAARFGTTRSAMVANLISNSVHEMYLTLDDKDRAELSKIADLETTAIYDKKGIEQISVGLGIAQGESTKEDIRWRMNDAAIKKYEEDSESADA